ncbi:hypothetical protein FLAG1_08509 [Fusarium langsethiae]|uniref:Uncharacterized protein n=1 Tax=Fusarium langsethiae TaxID=179993 RepID=A0A0M9ESL2_FUSLA|nr:hypothetical protein FLAG1_08509 [Fusarium langsethiae]GKU08280.1 unnamed protein product [Fusarium langsethiae]
MSQINAQISTAAVVSWQRLDNQRFLDDPDPKKNNLTFRTRFDETFSFFEILVPIYLKPIERRLVTVSPLILSIQPSTIETFHFEVLTTIPQPVETKLNSPVLRLDFKLKENVTTLIPRYVTEEPQQGRTQSGVVLDKVREISQTTSISVYIEHSASDKARLNSIQNALNKGNCQSTCKSQLDLQSLYQDQGVKIACFRTQSNGVPFTGPDLPPAYNEVLSSTLGTPKQKTKRRRVDHDGCQGDITPPWAKAMRETIDLLQIQHNVCQERLDEESRARRKLQERLDEETRITRELQGRLDEETRITRELQGRLDEETRMRQQLQKRVAATEQDLEQEQHSNESMPASKGQKLEQRLKTAEAEIESLQRQTDENGRNDGRIGDIEELLAELNEGYNNIINQMVNQDNLEDFRRDFLQDIARKIMGDNG